MDVGMKEEEAQGRGSAARRPGQGQASTSGVSDAGEKAAASSKRGAPAADQLDADPDDVAASSSDRDPRTMRVMREAV